MMPIRVLLADDDPAFREALERVLIDAGFSVRTARDGQEAIRILDAAHDSIDLAILDLNLPQVSGFEIIGAITRRKTVMGILAMTGAYRETFLEVAQYLGAHVAIRKPQNLEELKSWIPTIRSIIKAEAEIEIANGS